MTKASPLLQAENLCRKFGNFAAVDGLSLTLARGEVLGLLGLNGAGKSTTLSMLCGVLAPGSGWVRIAGKDIAQYPNETKACLGYLPDIPPLYPELRVVEYLTYAAKLHVVEYHTLANAVERALHLCQLEQVSNRIIGNLSKGYRQRVGLAQALIHKPALLILDEPSSGLDPVQMMEMRKLIRNLSSECGVILSTHILAEVTAVCDRVAILHKGKLIHEESLSSCASSNLSKHHLTLHQRVLPEELLSLDSVASVETSSGNSWQISIGAGQHEHVVNEICKRGWQVLEFSASRNNLEERFASLTVGADSHHETFS